jgi:predicted N-acetyltransferase YhbS
MAVQMEPIRPLERGDLADVVAIDANLSGRTRRSYVERRLAAALREPAQHAQFAARQDGRLVGYILARVMEGEFGRTEPGLRLEMIGVRADQHGHGTGMRLFEALLQWAGRHGVGDVRTSALWRETAMLHWLDAAGFALASDRILTCVVDPDAYRAGPESYVAPPPGSGPGHEISFGTGGGNDFERLARDTADVRSMTPDDLPEIARIDRAIIGRERRSYIAARLAEAMHDSAIRVSLTARRDGAIVGYVMARADLGDFGRTEPVAVIDTLGVDPDHARQGVGHALLSQLFANLGALRVERVETLVQYDNLELQRFFLHTGFGPSQRLAFVRRVDAAPEREAGHG